jgi:hypothetical protein
METFYWLFDGALALAGLAALWWDNAHGMHPGAEPDAPRCTPVGDVTILPADQQRQLHRARFERMDGVL